jgi:hypothetical protein
MMHPLDNPSIESFTIPGAKVFDRYFDCPLGKNEYSNEQLYAWALF